MAETITEKSTCEKCRADVREGTTFCYNCGAPLPNVPPPQQEPGDDESIIEPVADGSVDPAKEGDSNADKLAKAADERKKARVGQRKGKEYAWEPVDDSRLVILATLLIALIALVVVSLMVFWK